MSSTSPISFLSQNNQNHAVSQGSYVGDVLMGSYTNAFNPASYTRKVIGSPQTWKPGSFGSRFYPGGSPGQLLGPLDPTEFKCARLSSSIESDRGSLLNALNIVGKEQEMCRDYTCCGQHLNDLHALVEHFEECHVVVWDPLSGNYNAPAAPYAHAHPQQSCLPSAAFQGSFDPDDMEFDLEHNNSGPSSGGSTPPDTPVHTPRSTYPSVSAFDITTVLPSRSGLSVNPFSPTSHRTKRMEQSEVFTAYARAKEYAIAVAGSEDQDGVFANGRSGCVTPALLLSSEGSTPAQSPDCSRVNSPSPGSPTYSHVSYTSPPLSPVSPSSRSQMPSTSVSRPSSSLIVSKPFKCPKPNCNKSYKQANGLKYHMTHGSCNFTPCKEGEMLKEGMSDSEVREVEKRLRPYACGVGDCARRYKNMNGLRYHYQHSGDHGAVGLALLASGQHECLQGKRSGISSTHLQQQQQQQQAVPVLQTPSPDSSPQNFYQTNGHIQTHQVSLHPQQPQQYTMSMWATMNQS